MLPGMSRVPQDQVINIPKSPDELPIEVRRDDTAAFESLFHVLAQVRTGA